MPKKKVTGVKSARKRAASAVAKAAKSTKAARKTVSKRVAKTAKKVAAAASNPKRTVRRAAANVHSTAARARDIGESVVAAGELIQKTADVVDAVAQRSAARSRRRPKR
jgi:hypothetical protein